MPLVRSFWLGKKKGKQRYVDPVPDGKKVCFKISGPVGAPHDGTVSRGRGICVLCGSPAPSDYIQA